ncbi:Ig-like domain-containing protein, partial [bacterium]|nr:Ig-like domain-containing protein [bacterium]
MKMLKNLNGVAMLAVMVILLVGGIAATQLIPLYESQAKKSTADRLKLNIGEIRKGFDLKRASNPGCEAPLNESSQLSSISAVLASLTAENLMRNSDITDTTIPSFRWNTASNTTWRVVFNNPFNGSFEVTDPKGAGERLASWSASSSAVLASDSKYYPAGSSLDDYYGQNKFGRVLSNTGASLKVSSDNPTDATDTSPPTVSSFNPLDNATGVATNANLIVTFNENVFSAEATVAA